MSDDTIKDTRSKSTNKPPRMFKVIIMNDDFTPMEFVVDILTSIFKKAPAEANSTTLAAHQKGAGLVGTYARDIAETKTERAAVLAQSAGHPLAIECHPDA
jgi:ATP-dependent Clp protease adaptor protein ClpS